MSVAIVPDALVCNIVMLSEMSFAVTGAVAPATLDGVRLPPWWTAHAKAGQELRIDPPTRGARVVTAFAGGVDVPLVLGSRATDAKSGFGGLEGRGLKRGDRLAVGGAKAPRAKEFGTVPDWLHEDWSVLRVLPAAEFDAFDEGSLARFFGEEWTVSADANRQGYRLEGGQLTRIAPRELFSHGIVPGTVQVPASGTPIIQLADANTCGGYPKIATVVEADLWKLAQAPVGAKLRFQEATRAEGIGALRAQWDGLERLRDAVKLARG